MGLPEDIRPKEEKPRTGIWIQLRIPNTKNLILVSVYEPSEQALFFAIEKSVRTSVTMNITSQDNRDVNALEFAGNVTYMFLDNGIEIHSSISGMKEPEDVTGAIILLSEVTGEPINKVIKYIKENNGKLPKEIFKKDHYLKNLLDLYRKKK